MERKLVSNYLYNILYQMLLVILPFIITPYTTRTLQIDALSINTITANIIQWFVLFGIMGVNLYGNREIAKVRDDNYLLSKTFFGICYMQIGSMLLATATFFIFYFFTNQQYGVYLLVQSITLLSVALDITWFFYGVEDFKRVSLRNVFIRILNVILIFTFVKKPEDLLLFIVINVSMSLLGQLIMWFQVKGYVHFVKIIPADITKHIKPNIALFIPTIAISIYSVLDITMIRVLYPSNTTEVTLYEQAQKFVKMFLFFVTSIGSVMLPRITNVFTKNDENSVKNYLDFTFSLAMYLSIPMIFGIFSVIDGFVAWFLPANFNGVALLIKSISPIILFISLSNVFGIQYLVPTGKTTCYTRSVIAGALTNCIINFALIPKFGALGASIGSVCAELVVTIIQYYYTRKTIVITIENKELVKIIISSVIMFLLIYVIGITNAPSILLTFIQLAMGILIYATMLILLKSKFAKLIIMKIKNKQA